MPTWSSVCQTPLKNPSSGPIPCSNMAAEAMQTSSSTDARVENHAMILLAMMRKIPICNRHRCIGHSLRPTHEVKGDYLGVGPSPAKMLPHHPDATDTGREKLGDSPVPRACPARDFEVRL